MGKATLGVCALLCVSLTARTFHLDCAAGSDTSPGLTESTAWRTPARVSAQEYSAGDSILLKRGTRCAGQLWPKGSGDQAGPIRIGAYGAGALPIVDASGADSSVKLFNQHHWEIEKLELTGGSPFGLHIGGDSGELPHFAVREVRVHGVTGEPKTKKSGLIAVIGGGAAHISDVVVDGVTAYDTTQWAGIIVSGPSRENRIRNVTIRNSIVHDVYGDGIVMFSVEDGMIENSAAWRTGLQPVQTIGTPNAIWTWTCRRCAVRRTEGLFVDSPGVDGGVYDIDWGNDDNTVEENYGHDSQGYCASLFGASGQVTTNSIIRNNLCVDNGRSPKLARRQGDLYISTWNGGMLDGLRIENNTFYWKPQADVPAMQSDHAEFTGSRPNVVRGNIIRTGVSRAIHLTDAITLDNNKVERAEQGVGAACAPSGRYRLIAAGAGREQVVFLQTALAQYRANLDVELVLREPSADLREDWNLGDVRLRSGREPIGVRLLDPQGRTIRRWNGFVPPVELGAALRRALGVPNPFAASATH